jgi:hypothetical protein
LEAIAGLDSQLDRIANFVVANSLPPQPSMSKSLFTPISIFTEVGIVVAPILAAEASSLIR